MSVNLVQDPLTFPESFSLLPLAIPKISHVPFSIVKNMYKQMPIYIFHGSCPRTCGGLVIYQGIPIEPFNYFEENGYMF